MKQLGFLMLLISGAAAQAIGQAQNIANKEVMTLKPDRISPGQIVNLEILIPLPPEMHLYGPKIAKPYYATSVRLIGESQINWQEGPIYPAVKSISFFGEKIDVLEPDSKAGGVVIKFSGVVKETAAVGDFTVEAELTYQACSKDSCTPPTLNKRISRAFTVSRGKKVPATISKPAPLATTRTAETQNFKEEAPKTTTRAAEPTQSSQGSATTNFIMPTSNNKDNIPPQDGLGTTISLFDVTIDLNKSGIWLPLLVAFVAGLILNIMPCVLPVIPIKILQLAKQANQEHHSPLRLSLVFASGIILFFLVIAVLAIFLKGGFSWGQTFQSSSALIALSLILVLLALGMFDIYQVAVPRFIANRSFVQKGFLGALSMGFLAGILSTPCSFGILGAAVAWAQAQVAWVTIAGFLAIGIGMAFPYVFLSAFPKLLSRMPKTGRWTELFKQGMGFLLLAVAIFLISSLPNERMLWALLYMVLMAFVVWFWGVVLEFQKGTWAKLGRILAIVVLIFAGWGMLRVEPEPLQWQKLTPESLRMAQNSGKDVVVEFTADWCINCRTVEFLVFNDQRTKSFLRDRDVILLRGDLTEGDPFTKQILREWTGTDAPPFTIVFKTGNRKVLLPGIYSTGDLIQAIQTTPETGRSTWNEG
jgi:thiol:disulfide interchange protein DsbD